MRSSIIIEGCDRTGKTTLAKRLAKELNLPYRHFGPPPKDVPRRWQQQFQKMSYAEEIVRMQSQPAVYDRFLIGEAVYSPIYRNYRPLYIRRFEKAMPKGTRLILLTASKQTILDRFDGKFIKRSHIERIVKAFDDEFRASKIPERLRLSSSNASRSEILKKASAFARSRESLDSFYLNIAKDYSTRSTCDKEAVGAVLVKNGRLIAAGYNGAPIGLPHCDEYHPPHLESHGHCQTALHAEESILLFCARYGVSTEGATLYLTHFPCRKCTQKIIQAGIKNVRYSEEYKSADNELARALDISRVSSW